MLEKLIAYHCGPALAGIKPGNLLSCQKNKLEDIGAEIKRLNGELNKKDIFLEVICECEKRVLLFVYRKKRLSEYLGRAEIKELLTSCGYCGCQSTKAYISMLKKRMREEEFPHEIGAFLGYPAHDIYGFINKENCILVGEWRVYKDAENAKKIFARFKNCREAVLKRVLEGKTLAQIFCAA